MKYSLIHIRNTRKRIGLILLGVIAGLSAKAQSITAPPIPFEVMQGNEKFYSLMVVNKPFAQHQLSFFNVTTFTAHNDNEVSRNEFVSTTLISFPIYRDIRLSSGLDLNSVVGLNYFAGFQFSKVTGHWLIVLVPGIYFREHSSFETLGLVEFCPPISPRLKLYTRVHTLYNAQAADFVHNRSYNYLRLGLTAKRTSFGLGFNADWYGPSMRHEKNYGIFIRTEIP